jgi:hypothetical protein
MIKSDFGGAGIVQSVFIVSDYGLGFDPRQGQRVTSVSRPALRPIRSPVQWVRGGPFPGGKTRPGRDPDRSPHLVPKLRMSKSYASSPPNRHRGV